MRFDKHSANPVLGPDVGCCFDVAVLHREGRFQMWFSWRDCHSIGYTESTDGAHWSAPRVVIAPPRRPWYRRWAPACHEVTRPAVVFHSGLYHIWYSEHTDTVDLAYAVSRDGLAWEIRRRHVLRPDQPWEKQAVMCPCVLFDPAEGVFKMWYSGGEKHEPDAVGYATSLDGVHWAKHPDNPVLRADPAYPWEKDRVTALHVLQQAHGYLGFYIGFGQGYEAAAIGAASSSDGITRWQRCESNPVVRPGPAGAWDDCNVYKPFVLAHEDRLWLWYNASRASDRLEQIGLATAPATP